MRCSIDAKQIKASYSTLGAPDERLSLGRFAATAIPTTPAMRSACISPRHSTHRDRNFHCDSRAAERLGRMIYHATSVGVFEAQIENFSFAMNSKSQVWTLRMGQTHRLLVSSR